MITAIELDVCTDCLMAVANDDYSGMDPVTAVIVEKAVTEYQGQLTPGGGHRDDCPNWMDGDWDGSSDCQCGERGFSHRDCDLCRSILAGDRHAVTGYVTEGE